MRIGLSPRRGSQETGAGVGRGGYRRHAAAHTTPQGREWDGGRGTRRGLGTPKAGTGGGYPGGAAGNDIRLGEGGSRKRPGLGPAGR